MYDDFQHFLHALDEAGELRKVSVPVSPHLEMTEIADRCMKMPGGGPALLFQQPRGFDIPVAINTMGSWRRMAMALGVESVEEIARELEEILQPEIPATLAEKWALMKKASRFLKAPPKTVSNGKCQEVVLQGQDVNLSRLPVMT
ncbi:MAG: menaquinone biosynthesis decarboxylase, partial [Armatimonadota bacterium]